MPNNDYLSARLHIIGFTVNSSTLSYLLSNARSALLFANCVQLAIAQGHRHNTTDTHEYIARCCRLRETNQPPQSPRSDALI